MDLCGHASTVAVHHVADLVTTFCTAKIRGRSHSLPSKSSKKDTLLVPREILASEITPAHTPPSAKQLEVASQIFSDAG